LDGDEARPHAKRQIEAGPVRGSDLPRTTTAVEYYDTIFTIDGIAGEGGVIWVGADDGLIHVTQDDGKTWQT